MDPISPHLFLKVLPSLAKYAGQQALKQVRTPVSLAIPATAAEFPKYPNVGEWLHNWCASADFFQIQASLKEGDRVEPALLVASFASFVGVVSPDAAQKCAEEVLPIFFRKIDEHLLGSPGIAILDERAESRHGEVIAEQQNILGQIAEIRAAFTTGLLSIKSQDDPRPDNQEETIFDAKLDVVRQLLDSGRPNAAKKILEELETKVVGVESSTRLRFRWEALSGNCQLQRGEPADAANHLRLAAAIKPEDARSKANLSQALAWSGNIDDAVTFAREAINLAPDDAYVASVLVQRLSESRKDAEVDEFVKARPSFLLDPFFLRAAAADLYNRERFDEAAQMLQGNIKRELLFAPAWDLLGRCLLASIRVELRRDLPLPWLLPARLLQGIQEAETAFGHAIDLLENTDIGVDAATLYANRGLARLWSGQSERAEADYDKALSLDSSLIEIKPMKALMLVERRNFQAAIDLLLSIEPAKATLEVHTVLASAFMETQQPRAAIERLENAIRIQGGERRGYLRMAGLLMEAHWQLGERAAAKVLLDRVLGEFPSAPEAQCLEARYFERTGEVARARQLIERTYEALNTSMRALVALELASFYWRNKMFAEAAQIYEELATPSMPPGLRYCYVVSLLNAGEQGKAYEVAQQSRLSSGFSPDLAEVEERIAEDIGDLKGANSLLDELISRYPQQAPYFRVRLATNQFRMGDEDSCRETISRVARSELGDAPEALMQIAKLRHWLGLEGSLDFAYDAWCKGSARPNIALSYLFISLARQKKEGELLQTDVATSGCRVQLQRGEEKRTVDLVSESEPEFPPRCVRVNSVLGSRLVGARKGDHISLGDGFEHVVVEVQTKYVAAHQDVLRDFPFAFPEHEGLRSVAINDNDITPVLSMLEARHEFASAALRMYREKQMTAGTLGSVLGESMLDVWLSLVRTESERFLSATGSPEETPREFHTARTASAVVMGPTALMTMARLSRLSILPIRFPKVYVAQHVVDDFFETRAKREFGPASGGWIGKVGDRYVMTDHPNQPYLDDHDAILRAILEFIKNSAIIVPSHLQLQYSTKKFEEFERVLGHGPIASVLVAKELGLPLYDDDLGLRYAALNDWQVSGFWTQPLLLSLTGSILSRTDYFSAIRTLIENRYYFVQINAQYLLWLFETNNLSLSAEVIRGVSVLGDVEVPIGAAVRVAAEVVASCWANALPLHFKQMVLDALLSALAERRPAIAVLAAFRVAIQERVQAGTLVSGEIEATLRLWERVQFSPLRKRTI